MLITAHLDEAAARELLGELLPLTINLDEGGDDRWLRIDPASSVEFVVGEGLRVEVSGQIRLKKAGVPLLLTITSAQLLLRPGVVQQDKRGGQLVFRPALEKMDLKNIPDFVDSGIAGLINKRLAAQGDKLAWDFGKTLRSSIPMGKDLMELRTLELAAAGALVEVRAEGLILKVDLAMRFTRH